MRIENCKLKIICTFAQNLEKMRYFVWFSYDGTNYHGWQVQPNGVTVQSELERCLSLLLREQIQVTGAGRTDAGVHARQMAATSIRTLISTLLC